MKHLQTIAYILAFVGTLLASTSVAFPLPTDAKKPFPNGSIVYVHGRNWIIVNYYKPNYYWNGSSSFYEIESIPRAGRAEYPRVAFCNDQEAAAGFLSYPSEIK